MPQRRERQVKGVKQLIPCNCEMYAVYKSEENSGKFKVRVLAFGIGDLGYAIPLVFDPEIGLTEAGDESNFMYYEMEEGK